MLQLLRRLLRGGQRLLRAFGESIQSHGSVDTTVPAAANLAPMRLTVLGSGSAFSSCGCNAGYLVDGRVLVDCGAPVPALVRRAATSIHAITLILLTHFHADHSFMLPTILGARALRRHAQPPGRW